MNKYIYVAAFRDENFEQILLESIEIQQEFSICFEHEEIEAETEDDAYDIGNHALIQRIETQEEGYEKYQNQKIINDYVIKI